MSNPFVEDEAIDTSQQIDRRVADRRGEEQRSWKQLTFGEVLFGTLLLVLVFSGGLLLQQHLDDRAADRTAAKLEQPVQKPAVTAKATTAPASVTKTATTPAAPVAAPAPQEPPLKYWVKAQRGDTLSTICQAKTLSGREKVWRYIARRNNIVNPNLIRVGQLIGFPTKFTLTMAYRYHDRPVVAYTMPFNVNEPPKPSTDPGFTSPPAGSPIHGVPPQINESYLPRPQILVAEGDEFPALVDDIYRDSSEETVATAEKVVKGLDSIHPETIAPGQKLTFPPTLRVGDRILVADADQAELRWQARHTNAPPPLTVTSDDDDAQDALAFLRKTDEEYWPIYHPDPGLKSKEVAGYAMPLSREAAKGIVPKADLQTCIVVASHERCDLTSWAKPAKQGGVVLNVPIQEFPPGPFALFVAGPQGAIRIDGNDFVANARPITGRFPGQPGKFKRIFLGVFARNAANGLLASAMGGPVAGFTVGIGVPILRHTLHWVMTRSERSEQKLRKESARKSEPDTKEVRQ